MIKLGWAVGAIAAGIAAVAIAVGTVSAGHPQANLCRTHRTHPCQSDYAGVAGAPSARPTTPQAPASAPPGYRRELRRAQLDHRLCSGGDAACAAGSSSQAGHAWPRQAQTIALTRAT